ncbi:MAG: protein kinase [Acidimicrobiales bacterium]
MQHTGVAESYQLGVPHLQLGELIGGGGFARVFHGYDSLLRRHLAVKILRQVRGVELRDVFEAEAAAHGALSRHPNIVTIHQVGWTVDGSRPFLVMDHVSGGSLADYLADHGPVPWQHAVAWMIPVCSAVQHAHDHGILHRDIKPDNILLEPPGDPLLSDFGIACLRDETSPLPAMSIGHAAPEALRGERRGVGSDVYSLGSTLYHLLTGGLPFGGDPFARIRNADVAPAPLPADRVPAWLDEAVRRAMAPDPARRLFSARDLARALEAGAGQVTLYPPTVVARAAPVGPNTVDPRPPHPSVVPPIPPAQSPAAAPAATPGTVASTAGWPTQPSAAAPAATPGTVASTAGWAGPSVTGPVVTLSTPAASAAPPAPAAEQPAARSARLRWMTAAALLSAVLAVAATVAWARYEYQDGRSTAGDGTAVAGPAVTSADPATVTEPATLASQETGPGDTTPASTGGTEPATPATLTPTPSRTGTSSGGTGTGPTVVEPPGVTDPPPPVLVTVPDVANRTPAEATATLDEAGLSVDDATSDTTSCTVVSGRVVATNPAAGASVAKDSPVKLTVSSGAPTAKVPATVGKTEQEAKTALSNAGFTATVKAVFLPKGDADIGRVTAQSATAGTTASTCTSVGLTVGRQQLSVVTPGISTPTTTPKLTGP